MDDLFYKHYGFCLALDYDRNVKEVIRLPEKYKFLRSIDLELHPNVAALSDKDIKTICSYERLTITRDKDCIYFWWPEDGETWEPGDEDYSFYCFVTGFAAGVADGGK